LNYKEALEYIHGTYKFGIKLGLENIGKLLGILGEPQDKLKFIHIAGTNGKGSTASFIYHILREAGYKTGLFISPFIERFNERIQMNGNDISDSDLAKATDMVKIAIDKMLEDGFTHPTEFEVVTAIAMLYYHEKRCDIVILEVGLGGRYDSTNIINKPEVGIITKIALDHVDILGETLKEIAFEKGGIIKNSSNNIIYPQSIEVMNVIDRIASEKNAVLTSFSFADAEVLKSQISEQIFNYKSYKNLKISLNGKYQIYNAITAINCIEVLNIKGYNIKEESIREGIWNTKWPCRLELINKRPLIIVDGSHNIDGVNTLIDFIQSEYPDKKVIFVFGMMKDKDYKSIIRNISKYAKGFILVDIKNERALEPKQAANIIKGYCINIMFSGTINSTSDYILSLNGDEVVFAIGSFYYVGELKEAIKRRINE